MRAEIKGLSPEIAHVVGGHLRMAGLLMDEDPTRALAHAQAAKRRAGRLQVVREAMAEAAYAAEDYRLALAEYQALRRMTDDDNYLPVMADCQRAMGKPTTAIELLSRADLTKLTVEQQVEAILVMAGARQDLDQHDEALRLLQTAIAERRGGQTGQARLRYAYAALLQAGGDETGARAWYKSAAEVDPAQSADALRRIAALDGKPVSDDDDNDDEGDFEIAEVWDEPDDEYPDDDEESWDDMEFDDDMDDQDEEPSQPEIETDDQAEKSADQPGITVPVGIETDLDHGLQVGDDLPDAVVDLEAGLGADAGVSDAAGADDASADVTDPGEVDSV